MMNGWTRREMVGAGAGAGAAALLGIGARAAGLPTAPLFTLGVASGEPLPDGVVLWTRLAPEPLAGDGGMPARPVQVRWEVAEDADFRRIVRAGEAKADPAWGHSVHAEVTGLHPDRRYWYRFLASGQASAVGRTRTAPGFDAHVERLRFCYGSCQKYEAGRYAAWRDAVEADPDLIFFLGDYIYENDPTPGDVRVHLNPEPRDLPGYRIRYATYKLDPQLQAAHQVAPWAVIWDDHEVSNDYAGLTDQNNGDPQIFALRRAAAYKAYYEHMPLRATARPDGPAMRLYRTLRWGDLATFQLVDDRQYRSRRACQPPELAARHQPYLNNLPDCAERDDPARSILGTAQEDWLKAAFDMSSARWNLLVQQTLMSRYAKLDPDHPDLAPRLYSLDNWGGYPANRDRILRHWRDRGTSNPVVLSGDIHAFVAADMMDPDRPDAPPIASEFVGGSVTSRNHDPLLKRAMAQQPGFRFAEGQVRGYGQALLSHERLAMAFRGVTDSTKADSPVSDLARFAVESGRPGLRLDWAA